MRHVIASTIMLLGLFGAMPLRAGEFTDSAGRKVNVPQEVAKVFASGPPASVLVYVLKPDALTGWPRSLRENEKPYIAPAQRELPELGRLTGRGDTANLEVVLKTAPDLIIDFGSVRDTYISLADIVQTRTSIPYILIDGRFEATATALRLVGDALGVPERGEKLAEYTETLFADLDAALATIPEGQRPRVYLARGPDGLETGLKGSINTEIIDKSDYGRLAEFDALFIRETTAVNHHTYHFSRRAANLGLVVMDDPLSILRCTNKVYLAELLDHAGIPAPRTLIAHEDNMDDVIIHIGLPCVLKRPDGAFSQGVMKAKDVGEMRAVIQDMLKDSELVVAQEWMPTEYDWRIGVLDGKALFACRYHMAARHWQIAKHGDGESSFGKVDTMAIEDAPKHVVETAVKAANLIGRGIYGVDLKEVDGKAHIIEVNDNPNLDAGYEDAVLKDELWKRIAQVFLDRIEQARNGGR